MCAWTSAFEPLAEMIGKEAYRVKPTVAKLHYNGVDILALGNLNEYLSKILKEYRCSRVVPYYPGSINEAAVDLEYKRGKAVVKITGGREGVKNTVEKVVSILGKPDRSGPSILERVVLWLFLYENFKK